MSLPLVSVVVPTHNRPEMLGEALATVRAQTFTDYEVIVVSNGESDDVRRASHEVATAYDCLYFALPEGNVSEARNFGINQAKGEWIAFLDDDDLWLPEKLERQIDEARRTGADMIASDYIEFDHCGKIPERTIGPGFSPDVKTLSHMLWWTAPSTAIVRASILHEIKF